MDGIQSCALMTSLEHINLSQVEGGHDMGALLGICLRSYHHPGERDNLVKLLPLHSLADSLEDGDVICVIRSPEDDKLSLSFKLIQITLIYFRKFLPLHHIAVGLRVA